MDAAAAVEEPHVLAVDDNLLDRMLVEKLLKNSSCKVMYETPSRTEHLVCSGKGSFSVLFEDAAFINDSIVTTAENGQRALEYLGLVDDNQSTSNDSATKVNMIITDYCMPGMTGYELLKKIKESSIMKDVPVVIMSSENVPTRVDKCLEGGAELFMLKPLKCADVKKLRCQLLRNAAVKAS